jgi:hypothetical protein
MLCTRVLRLELRGPCFDANLHCQVVELMNFDSIFPNGLYIQDAYDMLLPVAIYVIGMALYGMFIFRFYRFVASRDMFGMDLSRYQESRFRWLRRVLHVIMYIAKYLVVFPAFAFFWFAVLTLILAFLSKDRPITDVLLIALATVSAIRVSAYYNEDLSRDMAKILPFAVLGIFLIDASFFDFSDSFDVLKQANDHRERILYYLLFLVGVEFVLRTLMGLVLFLFRETLPAAQTPPDDEGDPAASADEPDGDEPVLPDYQPPSFTRRFPAPEPGGAAQTTVEQGPSSGVAPRRTPMPEE